MGPIFALSTDATGQIVEQACRCLMAAGDNQAARSLLSLWKEELAQQPLIGLTHAYALGHLERLNRQGLNVGPETLDQI